MGTRPRQANATSVLAVPGWASPSGLSRWDVLHLLSFQTEPVPQCGVSGCSRAGLGALAAVSRRRCPWRVGFVAGPSPSVSPCVQSVLALSQIGSHLLGKQSCFSFSSPPPTPPFPSQASECLQPRTAELWDAGMAPGTSPAENAWEEFPWEPDFALLSKATPC